MMKNEKEQEKKSKTVRRMEWNSDLFRNEIGKKQFCLKNKRFQYIQLEWENLGQVYEKNDKII